MTNPGPWNPLGITQEDIMTEPIHPDLVTAIDQLQRKISELETRYQSATHRMGQMRDEFQQARANVTNLVDALFKLDDDEVTAVLVEHNIEPPQKEYTFTFRVVGTVSATISGTSEEDAWDKISTIEIDPNDIEDLEESGMGYDEVTLNETYGIDSYEIEHQFMRRSN